MRKGSPVTEVHGVVERTPRRHKGRREVGDGHEQNAHTETWKNRRN